jgi:hypothetical protein
MTTNSSWSGNGDFTTKAVEATIRIGALLLLASWCFHIVRPFVTPIVWGIVIAIAVYPGYLHTVTVLRGHHGLAAALLTVVMLLLLVVPGVFLSRALVENVQALAHDLQAGTLTIPPPPQGVGTWPVIGPPLVKLWGLASVNLAAAFEQLTPQLKVIAGWLVSTAAGLGLTVIQFVVSVIIGGVLLAYASAGHRLAHDIARRLAGENGANFVDLAEATVRSVARGVLGVALIQSLLAGIGLVAVGPRVGCLRKHHRQRAAAGSPRARRRCAHARDPDRHNRRNVAFRNHRALCRCRHSRAGLQAVPRLARGGSAGDRARTATVQLGKLNPRNPEPVRFLLAVENSRPYAIAEPGPTLV